MENRGQWCRLTLFLAEDAGGSYPFEVRTEYKEECEPDGRQDDGLRVAGAFQPVLLNEFCIYIMLGEHYM